jgi:hypothetical protein
MNAVDDFDLKDFMVSEEIPVSPSEHDRVRELFASAGFVVYFVERGCLHQVWKVCVNGLNGWERSAQTRRAIRELLASGSINVSLDRVTIVPRGIQCHIIFPYDAGDAATRVTYLRRTRNGISRCREPYTLVAPF